MMYPKEPKKKKRKRHKPSILHKKDGTCYLCRRQGNYQQYKSLHEHHIFGGPNRLISEAEGLKVYLCIRHHVGSPEAVHNNHDNMRLLRQDGQRAFEKAHSREEFMRLFGKNYLDSDGRPDE